MEVWLNWELLCQLTGNLKWHAGGLMISGGCGANGWRCSSEDWATNSNSAWDFFKFAVKTFPCAFELCDVGTRDAEFGRDFCTGTNSTTEDELDDFLPFPLRKLNRSPLNFCLRKWQASAVRKYELGFKPCTPALLNR
jgi:hypothetical protein